MSAVKVVLDHRADEDAEILAAYHRVSSELAGVEGLLGNELLQSTSDDRRFVVLTHWASREDFDRWEQSPSHQPSTAALRPFRDHSRGRGYEVLTARAAYGLPDPLGATTVGGVG